ncbi:MAG: SDR family oxidoreductase [Oscillospiraceae bacterium]|nr:SDR family oxidoreductase [Oscillospiraceae bacterium]
MSQNRNHDNNQCKVAMVTGGSSGIGQGIAIVLAEHGYDVAITYNRNPEGAEQTRADIEALGRRCLIYQASFQDTSLPAKLVDEVHEAYGRIDVMCCNAAKDSRNSILTVTPEEIEEMMRIDFAGYLLLAGAAARHMVRDGIKGSIFFTTSTRGERAYAEDVIYGGLKAAINRSCQSIALDLAPYGIRANCIAPGATRVRPPREPQPGQFGLEKAVPLGRMGTPRDSGELVAFLASGKASYITGTTIRVDGGLILSGPPEGWAEAHIINPKWTKRHYDRLMNGE